ncbi:MAG: dipeptidase PepE [Rikenellaceae bacterium]
MKLLLISNSTNAGEPYLDYPKHNIREFLCRYNVKKVMFVPYAAVTFSYDEYQKRVANRFSEIGIEVDSVHHYQNQREAIEKADAIVVGGGNTFSLIMYMQRFGLIEAIRSKVLDGTPYVGWSAGSNVTCPTICTTNDMPIVEPQSFKALNLIPFQINPHYLDAHPDGHAGETREQRIEEYIAANQEMRVVGLREGCILKIEDTKIELIGERPMRIFRFGEKPYELNRNNDLSFLL